MTWMERDRDSVFLTSPCLRTILWLARMRRTCAANQRHPIFVFSSKEWSINRVLQSVNPATRIWRPEAYLGRASRTHSEGARK